uniref:MAT2-1 n=1 Tax=Aspergillus pseudoglaucus TaxID=1405805 RepID=A0A3G6VE26_ASPPE|nr:MAT2-1 [Aspergillus pseudoglaucus]
MATVPIAMRSDAQSPESITELLWQDALRHLFSTNEEVLPPINVTDMIGQDNVERLKSRLGALLGAPVVSFVDESLNALRVLRTPEFSGSAISVASMGGAQTSKRSTVTESFAPRGKPVGPLKAPKVPRPPNAFILYRQRHHPKIKEAYPDYSNNDISVMLGKQWKDENEEIKAQFRNLAEELKKKHAEDHPDYHYTPRKPYEKKRRNSSRCCSKAPQRFFCNPSYWAMTYIPSDVSSPAMVDGMPVGAQFDDCYFSQMDGENAIMPQRTLPANTCANFDPFAFDLFQQVQSDYHKTALYRQLAPAEQFVGESFEFLDLISDYY